MVIAQQIIDSLVLIHLQIMLFDSRSELKVDNHSVSSVRLQTQLILK